MFSSPEVGDGIIFCHVYKKIMTINYQESQTAQRTGMLQRGILRYLILFVGLYGPKFIQVSEIMLPLRQAPATGLGEFPREVPQALSWPNLNAAGRSMVWNGGKGRGRKRMGQKSQEREGKFSNMICYEGG